MPKFKPQYRRLLFVDRKIRQGDYPNCKSLAEEWESSTRTIQRDIDYLKYELDAPIAYDSAKRGYYFADKTWFIPSVMLTEGELTALLISAKAMAFYCGNPVADDLRRIYAKLSDMVDEKIEISPDDIRSRVSFINPPVEPIEPMIWQNVLHAVLFQKVFAIEYHPSGESESKTHVLHPYHILNVEGVWYILAHDVDVGKLKQFEMSCIVSGISNELRFKIPADFDLALTLRDRFGSHFSDS